jgi:hypothetical protein
MAPSANNRHCGAVYVWKLCKGAHGEAQQPKAHVVTRLTYIALVIEVLHSCWYSRVLLTMATVLALRVLAHRSRPIAAGAVSGACEAWARRHTESSAYRQQPPLQQQTRHFRSSRSAADDEFYKVLGVPKSASAADIKKV